MKHSKNTSLPWPLLTPPGEGNEVNDFIYGRFRADVQEINHSPQKVTLECHFQLQDQKDLQQLIDTQQAHFVVEFDCSKTNYRRIFRSYQARFRFDLPRKYYDGDQISHVFSYWICNSQQPLPDYQPVNIHGDYGDAQFRIPATGILAATQEPRLRGQQAPQSGPNKGRQHIFSLEENKDHPDKFYVDCRDDHKVTALVPAKVLPALQEQPLLKNMIGLTVVMEVLTQLNYHYEEHQDKVWAKNLIKLHPEHIQTDGSYIDLLSKATAILNSKKSQFNRLILASAKDLEAQAT